MDLTFHKDGGSFVAEFVITADFNLHLEGVLLEDYKIYQKTAGNAYARVQGLTDRPNYEKVLDFDFSGVVYPKTIKIVSEVEHTLAVVTSAGEVTEIKPVPKYYIEYTHQGSYSMEATAKMKEAIDKIYSLTSEFDWVQFNTDEVQIIVKYNVSGEPAREFLMTQTKSYGPTSVYVKNDEFSLGINTENDMLVVLTGQLL